MLEFEVTRNLPPPIGQLSDSERGWVADTLVSLRSGDSEPLERALQEVLECRVSEEEFGDFLLFTLEERRAILQRVADQVPELAGVRLDRTRE